LIAAVRPTWQVTSYSVKDGVFPNDINIFDGVMISGSPASVHDSNPWVADLLDLIRDIYTQGLPMFGACFGHQAIAMALGGRVGPNPNGWVFGLTHVDITHKTSWMQGLPMSLKQYGAHIEQVIELPDGAEVLSSSIACHIAGFHIADKVYTTQNHPEMTPDFITALVAEYAPKLPADVAAKAKASLADDADTLVYAHSIAQFFCDGGSDLSRTQTV
jgi:GMP synthase-like glutamine amidotransferase